MAGIPTLVIFKKLFVFCLFSLDLDVAKIELHRALKYKVTVDIIIPKYQVNLNLVGPNQTKMCIKSYPYLSLKSANWALKIVLL